MSLTYTVIDCSSDIASEMLETVTKKLLNNYGLKTLAKGEKGYKGICGFCFEMQNFPDAVNHSEFPSVILRADEKYNHVTSIQFGIVS